MLHYFTQLIIITTLRNHSRSTRRILNQNIFISTYNDLKLTLPSIKYLGRRHYFTKVVRTAGEMLMI